MRPSGCRDDILRAVRALASVSNFEQVEGNLVELHLDVGQEEWAVATTIVTAPGNGKSLREGTEA